jgi:hypothetical protein
MPDGIRISVVIPCFDQGRFLADALDSVLAQTRPPCEIIVVDDGSHDDTSVVASRYAQVRCLRQRRRGLAAARNAGFEAIESRLGDSFHGSAAYWGASGAVDLTPEPGQSALHVDTYFMAAVDDAPDPDVHVWFDLVVSGGCQPDGTLTPSIDPVDVHDDASLGVLEAIAGAFECVGTGAAGATCIQSGVEDTVRAAFSSLSSSGFTMHGVGACQTDPTLAWRVTNTGDIVLE